MLFIAPIIRSMIDQDLYKLTMCQAVHEKYHNTFVSYTFRNRGKHRFNQEFFDQLKEYLEMNLPTIALTELERQYLLNLGFFKPQFVEFLNNFRFDPKEIETLKLTKNGQLELTIVGPWHRTILWEVMLMAIISELYFRVVDTDWTLGDYHEMTREKAQRLSEAGCFWVDFGTRRRRSFEIQNLVVNEMKQYLGFAGTSNVYLAMLHGVKPIGTMAHEWVMGVSALSSLRYANRSMMYKWNSVYEGNLGIALTDTFGSDAFFRDFDLPLAKMYDGVRHDSGNPFRFGERVIEHYNNLGIDPTSKTLVFSDGLDVDTAIKLQEYFEGRIKISFGIGTHLTNDFKDQDSPALNMVIKLWAVDGVPVVKLSDNPGKEIGEPNAVKVAKWTFRNEALT